ncbi:hypothetical protein BC938DRAFT_482118 [Jimgerdemannia flammicorona]|uniref:Uncharacterized protein n=1 Tax=Jimgerdemannia flammicorona TaxID=994334 RepID=A0A433QF62_9FUNG|nr:hypothetical protein BC938DRAFT_482118 [Jimgerdemannia flammicorona]
MFITFRLRILLLPFLRQQVRDSALQTDCPSYQYLAIFQLQTFMSLAKKKKNGFHTHDGHQRRPLSSNRLHRQKSAERFNHPTCRYIDPLFPSYSCPVNGTPHLPSIYELFQINCRECHSVAS